MSSECPKHYTSKDKWIVSIISGLLFLLVASPFLFSLVNDLTKHLGLVVASPSGCPTTAGLVLHAIVFTLIVRLMMR